MPPQHRKKVRRAKCSLVCFGLGNELVSVTSAAQYKGAAKLRTFVLDRLPSRSSWFPLYEEVLAELGASHAGSRLDLLRTSQSLRGKLESALALCVDESGDVEATFPLDREWRQHCRDLLKTWKALELVHLEKNASLRELTMDFANYMLLLEGSERLSEDQLGFFERGEAFLMQGRFSEASVNFKKLIVGAAGRLRRFYELLVDLCSQHDSAAAPGWKDGLSSLAVYVVKENAKEHRLVELLTGKVPALVRYLQSDDAAVWGGRSWPRLLAAVLCFHEPNAKRHVLPQLAERCAAAFGVHKDSDAALAALQGEALKAIQLVHNRESLGEAILGEILSRAGILESPSLTATKEPAFVLEPWAMDIRQLLWCNFALALGLGPGRVWERPVDDDGSMALRISLSCLDRANLTEPANSRYRELLVDRMFVATDRTARGPLLRALTAAETTNFIASRVGAALRSGDINHACRWAERDPKALGNLVQWAVGHYLHTASNALLDVDLSSSLGRANNRDDVRLILQLYQAKAHLDAGDHSKSLECVCDCVETLPICHRRNVLRRVLGLDLPTDTPLPVLMPSSSIIVRLMHIVGLSGSSNDLEKDAELRATLGLMFCEALKREVCANT